MTKNGPPNKLEWLIRPRSGVDSAQWYWGIKWVMRKQPFCNQTLILPGILLTYYYEDATYVLHSTFKKQ